MLSHFVRLCSVKIENIHEGSYPKGSHSFGGFVVFDAKLCDASRCKLGSKICKKLNGNNLWEKMAVESAP